MPAMDSCEITRALLLDKFIEGREHRRAASSSCSRWRMRGRDDPWLERPPFPMRESHQVHFPPDRASREEPYGQDASWSMRPSRWRALPLPPAKAASAERALPRRSDGREIFSWRPRVGQRGSARAAPGGRRGPRPNRNRGRNPSRPGPGLHASDRPHGSRPADHAAAVVGSGRLTGDGAQFAFLVLLVLLVSSAVSRIRFSAGTPVP
jgi:hypothetical protein